MPEARLQRTREAYLCGRSMVLTPWRAIVQFGAHNYATDFSGMGVSDTVDVRLPSTAPQWRPPHENAADRLKRYQTEFETDRDCGDERAT